MDNVTVSGPVFDGRAAAAGAAGCEAIRRALAEAAMKATAAQFAAQIRNGTGRFTGSMISTRTPMTVSTESKSGTYTMPVLVPDPVTDIAVTTDIATYGPFLEGVGSRNETTAFKGYHGFRQATQELNQSARTIAAAVLLPYAAAMNR